MKIKYLIASLSLAGALGVGVLCGIKSKEPVEAEAKLQTTYSGSFYVELQDVWKSGDCSIAFYLFNDDDPSNHVWYSQTLDPIDFSSVCYEFSYENLSFQPAKAIASRIYKGSTPDDWCFDVNNGGVYNRTNNIDLNDAIWLGSAYDGKWSNSGSYSIDTFIKGAADDVDWSILTVDTQLSQHKLNSSHHIEMYGLVSLPAGTYFKTYTTSGSAYYGAYSALSGIQSNFSGGGSSNIHNTEAGTYEMYFDYTSKSLYITDPIVAAADEWSEHFISGVGCDPTGVSAPTHWSDFAETGHTYSYADLDDDVKDYIYGAQANESGTATQHAVYLYDLAISHHGSLSHFITNHSGTPRQSTYSSNSTSITTPKSNVIIPIIVVIALVSVTTIGFVLIQKKKHE